MTAHRHRAAALAALLLAAALAGAAVPARAQGPDLAGGYDIVGTDPVTRDIYHGTAVLTRRGAAYLFEAEIDGMRYAGLGLHDAAAGVLALSFLEGENARSLGVTVLRVEGGSLRGTWVSRGEALDAPGGEVWTRR